MVMNWMTRTRLALTAAGLLLACAWPAAADEAAAKLAASHLEAGTLAAGDAALSAVLDKDPGNDEARLGLGTIRFIRAVEHLSQGLYRYGLQPPKSFLIPVVRLPVPENPNPQPITFQHFRGLLQTFVTDLGAAEATLALVKSDNVKLVLDLDKLRYDPKGDGIIGDDERLISVIERVTGMARSVMPNSLVFAFDQGDALWLQGYCNLLMAFGDFFVAYDWHESFDTTFFHFFPKMSSPFRDALAPVDPNDYFASEGSPIADFISFLHIRWPLAEPARMHEARDHLKKVIALSRASWAAIEAETDNDREWIPNERQTSAFQSVIVDEKRIASWHAVLEEADAILDGKKLVPHWRLRQGINIRRVFEEPQPFDFVLWITGPAALPYLEDGPVATSEEWSRITDSFGGGFGIFAVWFN
jgi:hypothetical protein